jgi:hypothetical protein
MKSIFTTVLLISITTCFAQTSSWAKWFWLVGDWKGEGSGQPGQGSGVFSFNPDLDNKILVRKAHSTYPAQGGRSATIHDDLLIVYLDVTGDPSKAIYFDNEGHTIHYSITYTDRSIVLLSEKIPNVPIFRLTYSYIDDLTVNTKFEMSQDGVKFMTYVEGRSKILRKKEDSGSEIP